MRNLHALKKKFLLAQPDNRTTFEYKILFVSAIPPHYTSSLNVFASNSWQDDSKLPSKYFIKSSYLILAWFYQLQLITTDKKSLQNVNNKKIIKFSILPSKRTHYTLIKAPMAHKKNSKEQFEFKFYFITASFKGQTEANKLVTSCDAAASLLLLIKKAFPVFSTNVLFLKTSRVWFTYHDCKFFNYSLFILHNKHY
jgi:hypothetical protein